MQQAIFTDRRHPTYEYQIVVEGDRARLRRSVFPGYSDRQWWVLTETSEEFRGMVSQLMSLPADFSAPTEPSGPWFIRSTLSRDDEGQAVVRGFFENENARVAELMKGLRIQIQKAEMVVGTEPEWSEEMLERFGYSLP